MPIRQAATPTRGIDPVAGDRLAELPSGRRVSYRDFGAPDGVALIALHGTPGSRHKFLVADDVAKAFGVRIIAPDRWGYGGTDAHPAPTLAGFAGDMVAFANQLGLQRFAVMGVSGGGPYATAVAALSPSRVLALALAAPVGPISGEPDSEITAFHRFCFGPFARQPAAVGAFFMAFRAVLGVSPALAMRLAMVRVATADRRVLGEAAVARRLAHTMTEGLRPGVMGPVTDMTVFGRPWGIDLAAARVPARIWLGTADQNVPGSAARRLAKRLPDCELVELPGDGHLWIARNHATVLEWIVKTQKGAAWATPSQL